MAASRKQRSSKPSNSTSTTEEKTYRVVPVSLYAMEADWISHVAQLLKKSGNPRASRSLVVREAIHFLHKHLSGKEAADVLKFFLKQQRDRGHLL